MFLVSVSDQARRLQNAVQRKPAKTETQLSSVRRAKAV
jgi:hypothetical protein